ncbi:uncharacterized protein FIBRA_03144 [Fibroporia radiculosa]|uniref:Fungal-type protein kinase domain-containing protein n=1 Tax=Fibroporia radiculosa TaxID=599839 RepID=J4I9G0_9APHY|nr:uncharacterized protein FIBRA_03144 [Fibroporia radiculosa]CCM01096.1 predicted protein [Fibroporia radiculosa]
MSDIFPPTVLAQPKTPPPHQPAEPVPIPESTPRSLKQSSYHQNSVSKKRLEDVKRRLAKEMDDQFVEVSVETFMDAFVPGIDPDEQVQEKFVSFADECYKRTESHMYPNMCEVIQSVLDTCSKDRLAAKATGNWPDFSDKDSQTQKKPDVTIYPTTDAAERAYKLADADLKKKSKSQQLYGAHTSWAWSLLPIELKSTRHTERPFYFGQEGFLRPTSGGSIGRGQISDYAANLMRRQHRLFCFMIVVAGRHARLLRWDRVGAVVSKDFDFVADPGMLQNFFYRFGNMDSAQRGFDPTVKLARAEYVEEMKEHVEGLSGYHKKCFEDALSHQTTWPLYEVTVHRDDVIDNDLMPRTKESAERLSGTQRSGEGPEESSDVSEKTKSHEDEKRFTFIVGKYRAASYSPTGRATKGYVAFDMFLKKLVFVKDTWRVKSSRVPTERQVYEDLWKHQVKNIVTPLCGGDVRALRSDGGAVFHVTETQKYLKTNESARVQYRLIVYEVCQPLQDYKDSRQLIKVLYDALRSHRDAWERARILHRDISVGNVMIEWDGTSFRGILNDWDLCKYKDDLKNGPIQPQRSGTWQFMSALLLKDPKKLQEVSDDLESFVHLTNWLVLRYHEHGLSGDPEVLKTHVTGTYDAYTTGAAGDVGGDLKFYHMNGGHIPFGPIVSAPLEMLTMALAEVCKEHYQAVVPQAVPSITRSQPVQRNVPQDADESEDEETAEAVPIVSETLAVRSPSRATLSTHKAIMAAFRKCLWIDADDKVDDQFATFSTPASVHRTIGSSTKRKSTSGNPSSANKRRRVSSEQFGSTGTGISSLDVSLPVVTEDGADV